MKKSEKNKLRTLNIFMQDCSCNRCGPGKEEVIEKEYAGFDPITEERKDIWAYNKQIWHTPYDDLKNYENVARTLEGTIVVNDGDYEETTQKEYEEHLSYWRDKIAEDYIRHIEHEKELRRELYGKSGHVS